MSSSRVALWVLTVSSCVSLWSCATVSDADYVAFAACTVTLGNTHSPSSAASETDRVRVAHIGRFEMARSLVTVAEFARFLDERVCAPGAPTLVVQRSFAYCPLQQEGEKWVYRDEDSSRPIDQATWFGAKAYCDWLTRTKSDGYSYSLPSEWEWEYAARGMEGRPWPWGSKEPSSESGWEWVKKPRMEAHQIREPTIGSFPAGATPQGITDMMGYGCLEWCVDEYVADPGDSVSCTKASGERVGLLGAVPRVARGGARVEKAHISMLEAWLSETHSSGRVWSRWACDPIEDVKREPFVFRVVRRPM